MPQCLLVQVQPQGAGDMPESILSYEGLINEARITEKPERVADYLRREIPYLWQDAYFEMTPRLSNIVIFTHGSFDYVYDDYATLENTSVVASDGVSEARLVGAIGFSQPNLCRAEAG